jgi:hypothetical protein
MADEIDVDSLEWNKANLMMLIDRSWSELNAALSQLSEEQATKIKDEQGWTVKDHLVHLAAWERSALFLLRGKPRHEGLRVEESVYENGDDDQINDNVYRQTQDLSLNEAREELTEVHGQMLQQLEGLSDEDLHKPYSHYLPTEGGDERKAIEVVAGNTFSHFTEHLGWMRELLGRTA